MNIILCLVFLLCVFSCLSGSDVYEKYFLPGVYDYKNDDHKQEESYPIERPCSFQDVDCIRGYFAHNALCTPTHGPAPDPYLMKILPLDVAHVNITFILNDVIIKGLNEWKIEEFYVNKKTDKLVLEVEFKSIKVNSTSNVIRYNRKGKEPLELAGLAEIDYRSLSFTMTAPNIRNIDISKALVFTHVSDVAPKYSLDNIYTDSKEPDVIEANKKLLGNVGLSLQEAFIKMGPVFMSVFLQSSICDFHTRTVYI